jgi:hypothetical protein
MNLLLTQIINALFRQLNNFLLALFLNFLAFKLLSRVTAILRILLHSGLDRNPFFPILLILELALSPRLSTMIRLRL